MDKKEMVEAALALVEHLEADRLEDAQALTAELDYAISQAAIPAPPASPAESRWVSQTLAAADREARRKT